MLDQKIPYIKKVQTKNEINMRQHRQQHEASEQRLADQARIIRLNGWLREVQIEELKYRCKRSDEQVEVENETNKEVLDMRGESVKDGNQINDKESFQSSADEQGFDDEDKDLLKEVLNYMKDCPGNIPPNMMYKERKRAKRATAKINKIISVTSTQNINKKTKKEDNDIRGGE